ncbi:MAG: DUF4160 domain-containing protein [Alphaproteobacteria bacterium]|nr:DUF4160 domain-containing protein [Alphaproteobacteria bacterium]MBL7096255.1 DUF4160 domain-containing protein [Alphaproteobacteria bacterium]
MPTVLIWNGYRFYFFSNEGNEPPHIHVDRGDNSVKLWLEPVSVARAFGFPQREVRVIAEKVTEERERFLQAWNEYFRNHR